MKLHRIGDVTRQLGISADTLRYYEKIGLIKNVTRSESGVRLFSEKHLSQLKFIKRTQRMNFSLSEIGDLLTMRDDPQHARTEIRQLTRAKLQAVENHLNDLHTLKNELTLLVNLCADSENGCPIIDYIDDESQQAHIND